MNKNTTVNAKKDLMQRAAWSALVYLEMVVHLLPKPTVSESAATSSSIASAPPSSMRNYSSLYASSSEKCHNVPCTETVEIWGSSMLKIVEDARQMDILPPFNAQEKSSNSGNGCLEFQAKFWGIKRLHWLRICITLGMC
eukprot:11428729-Ditylum_brightwellii.AAC.1